MPANIPAIPLFTAHGDPATVGRALGKEGRSSVHTQLANIHRILEQLSQAPNRSPAFNRDRAAMGEYLSKHFPGEVAEVRGIAEGAGVSFDDALLLSTAPSLGELATLTPHHCSTVAWRHADGEVRLFKTDDGPGYPAEGPTAAEMKPRLEHKRVFDIQSGKALRTLAVNDIGRVFCEAGINEAGVAMGHSSGRPVLGPQDGMGIPQHMFPGLVLRYCTSCEEAITFAHQHPVAGKGLNIVVADADGAMVAIEKCARYTGIRQGGSSMFVVNHYLEAKLAALIREQLPDFYGGAYHKNSDDRRIFLETKLQPLAGDPQAQLSRLLEHNPGTVCQHIGTPLGTQYAVYADPRKRSMEVFVGPPCAGQRTSHGILERVPS